MKTLIEAATLLGGALLSLLGVITSMRQRRREDRQLEAQAGLDAVAQSKAVQDIATDLQGSYLSRVQANADLLRTELDRTLAELRACYRDRSRAIKMLADAGIDFDGATKET